MISFLWRSFDCPEPSNTDNPFTDVKSTDFFYKAVLWAKEKGITSGKTKDRFAPYESCTRGQFVTFLWRACRKPEIKDEYYMSQVTKFSDVPEGSDLEKAVIWASFRDITQGITATKFKPSNEINRAQAVTFLYRGNQQIDYYKKNN